MNRISKVFFPVCNKHKGYRAEPGQRRDTTCRVCRALLEVVTGRAA